MQRSFSTSDQDIFKRLDTSQNGCFLDQKMLNVNKWNLNSLELCSCEILRHENNQEFKDL